MLDILGMNYECYFLDKPILELKVRLVKTSTDQKPVDNDTVGVVNNLLHSLLRSVDIKIGETKVSGLGSNYPHRAYVSGRND
jgi:hypothetical protein